MGDELEIALDRQRRVLPCLMERGHEDPEAETVGHVVYPQVGVGADRSM
jgi:hypothetical protein